MRFVDRSRVNEPPSLSVPSATVQDEKSAATTFYGTYDPLAPKAKGFPFVEYKSQDVTYALRVLFHSKCAYCESDLGDNLDVEHFRPKGGVTEDPGHSGYWWLAHSWDNLLPSCITCNQKRRQHLATEAMTIEELSKLMATRAKVSYGKANQFPILGARAAYGAGRLEDERALLIDPSIDDPNAFLLWSQAGTFSIVLAKPTGADDRERALCTINVFALNRLNLVQSRTRVLRELRFQAAQIERELEEDMIERGSQRHVNRALRRVSEMRRLHGPGEPYSAMVKAFVDDFAATLVKRIKA